MQINPIFANRPTGPRDKDARVLVWAKVSTFVAVAATTALGFMLW